MVVAQSFDRLHVRAVRLRERHEAGADGGAINEHRTSAALPFSASFLRPGEPELLAQNVEQPGHRRRGGVARLAVQSESHSARCSGVAGISLTSIESARRALTTAGAGPSIGSSPKPFAPNGPPGYGFSSITTSNSGVSSDVGIT